jgi:hypothetical protein
LINSTLDTTGFWLLLLSECIGTGFVVENASGASMSGGTNIDRGVGGTTATINNFTTTKTVRVFVGGPREL